MMGFWQGVSQHLLYVPACLQDSFTADIKAARGQEARILRITAFWQGIFGVLLFSGPVMVAIFCFGSYTIAGNVLTAANVGSIWV